jgi:hypothetical protein
LKKELSDSFGKVFISISFDSQDKWVYNNWMGYQTFENVVAGANACLEVMEHAKVSCLLNDNRLVVGPWHHATDWAIQDWIPRAMHAGLKYFAHVVNQQTLAGMTSAELYRKVGNMLEMKVFDNLEEARQWLSQCQ